MIRVVNNPMGIFLKPMPLVNIQLPSEITLSTLRSVLGEPVPHLNWCFFYNDVPMSIAGQFLSTYKFNTQDAILFIRQELLTIREDAKAKDDKSKKLSSKVTINPSADDIECRQDDLRDL